MRIVSFVPAMLLPLFLALSACGQQADEPTNAVADRMVGHNTLPRILADRGVTYTEEREACENYDAHRMPLFGDVHVHTALSFDAVAGRIKTMPKDAHDFARGKPIPYFPQREDGSPAGEIQIKTALDFVAVTDHAEFLGERELCANPSSPKFNSEFCVSYRQAEFRGLLLLGEMATQDKPQRNSMLCGDDGKLCREYAKGPWDVAIAAAEEAYDRSSRCRFTSFIAYEYTGTPFNSNYHRNVIFRNGEAPSLPVSYAEARYDYQLWEQLDASCNTENGCQYLTIPHNSNLSNGQLLGPYADLERSPENKLAYATTRLRAEPLMEIFQHKGASECINGLTSVLGAADELCAIEQVRSLGEIIAIRDFDVEGPNVIFHDEQRIETTECGDEPGTNGMFRAGCVSRNDYLRTALLTGLKEEQRIGANPVKLGVVAATDGHSGVPGAVDEKNWAGFVSSEMTVDGRLAPGTLPTGINGNPGGLAGVWAVENSRDAIFEAMQRREVFGTSGPRIVPRFFAGWNYAAESCAQPDMVSRAYAGGVPMGGDLPQSASAQAKPRFILAAQRDPNNDAAALQQLQIIKGWIDSEGVSHNAVVTVAGSQDDNDGHSSFCAVYEDAHFDPAEPSYYYLRAVELPTPRWSYVDCNSLAPDARPAVCADESLWTIQEMAWSSPIWYTPTNH